MYDDIVSFYHEIFPLNQAFLAFITPYLGGPGARVLDLGCGPGDYVDTLSRQGYQATGIDPSAEMIRQAQSHKGGTFYAYGFSQMDQLAGPFDCIFSIGNSLSYHPVDQMGEFCIQAARLLRLGGYLSIQVVNWDRYSRVGASDFEVKTLSDGRTFHRRYAVGPKGSVIFHTEIRHGETLLNAWSAPLYPKYSPDLQHECEAAGLVVLSTFGDFVKSPYDSSNSPATILVARKDATA
jgi:SAM-dependent methyltransferase